MAVTAHDLFTDPDHFLFAFEGPQAVFRAMDRAAYARSIFLDARIQPARADVIGAPAAALAQFGDTLPPPPAAGWIFHVAHCGSTLLARALEGADTLVLREPLALRQVAADPARHAAGAARAGWDARLRLTARLLSRRYRPTAPAIVKANVPVNFILPDLLATQPQAPAIFLYYPLETYLLAILRGPNHRRWVEAITAEMRRDIEAEAGPLAGLSDAELAAALWLAQVRLYDRQLSRHAAARSLDAETLFDRPGETLAAAFALFGVKADAARVAAVVGSELFRTYAKQPGVAFDNQDRRARQEELRRNLAGELAAGRRLVEARAGAFPLPERLGRPLVGEAPLLV